MYDASHMLTYTLAGLVLAGLWVRTRSLAACVIAHGTYNAWIALEYAGWRPIARVFAQAA
jgi:membrane protease YdiL (CAAX protease family)